MFEINCVNSPRYNHIVSHLLNMLKLPLLASHALTETNPEILNGYADVVLQEANKQKDINVLAAYANFIGV